MNSNMETPLSRVSSDQHSLAFGLQGCLLQNHTNTESARDSMYTASTVDGAQLLLGTVSSLAQYPTQPSRETNLNEGVPHSTDKYTNDKDLDSLLNGDVCAQDTDAKDVVKQTSSSISSQCVAIETTAVSAPPMECNPSVPKHTINDIPDCDIKFFLLDIGRTLGKPDDELVPLLKKVICEHWIDDINCLRTLSPSDWAALNVPHLFSRAVQERLDVDPLLLKPKHSAYPSVKHPPTAYGKNGGMLYYDTLKDSLDSLPSRSTIPSTGETAHNLSISSSQRRGGSPVADFITNLCLQYKIPMETANATIHCLCDTQWIESIGQLGSLTPQDWDCLDIDPVVAQLIQCFSSSNNYTSQTDHPSLQRLIFASGLALNRPIKELCEVAQKLSGVSLEAIVSISTSDWLKLKLPIPLLNEMRSQLEGSISTEAAAKMSRLPFGNVNETINAAHRAHTYNIVASKKEAEEKRVTVEQVLLKAGQEVGKSATEMDPIVEKVVRTNWITSIRTLSVLTHSEMLTIGIPKRVADVVRSILCDPTALELTLVQFEPYEANMYPGDLSTAAWRMEGEIPLNPLYFSIRSLVRLIETVLCDPFDAKRRMIRKSNPNFQRHVDRYKSGCFFIECMGYEDMGSVYALFVACVPRLTEAHAVLTQLAHVVCKRMLKPERTILEEFLNRR